METTIVQEVTRQLTIIEGVTEQTVINETTTPILLIAEGRQGATGVSDRTYVHTQPSASATWTINHTLGKYPSVTVVDSAGTQVMCDVQHIDTDNVTLTFSSAFSGAAYLN